MPPQVKSDDLIASGEESGLLLPVATAGTKSMDKEHRLPLPHDFEIQVNPVDAKTWHGVVVPRAAEPVVRRRSEQGSGIDGALWSFWDKS